MPSGIEIMTALAGGARIVVTGGRGYDCDEYELRQPGIQLTQSDIMPLLDKGWIYSSNTAYLLSDEGKKAYLRSTDELGDGALSATPPVTAVPATQVKDEWGREVTLSPDGFPCFCKCHVQITIRRQTCRHCNSYDAYPPAPAAEQGEVKNDSHR